MRRLVPFTFELVEPADQSQDALGGPRPLGCGFEEAPTRVRPAAELIDALVRLHVGRVGFITVRLQKAAVIVAERSFCFLLEESPLEDDITYGTCERPQPALRGLPVPHVRIAATYRCLVDLHIAVLQQVLLHLFGGRSEPCGGRAYPVAQVLPEIGAHQRASIFSSRNSVR